MKHPIWTEKYKPQTLDDIKQKYLKKHIKSVSESGMNCLIRGPRGVGKTTLGSVITESQHKNPERDTVYINVADIFSQNKKEVKNDEKFSEFLSNKNQMSKNDMINHIIKETASYPPVTGGYKTLLLDNMEDARVDFQHSLRRIIEKFSRNTQFILTSRDSSVISPIQSRCYPIYIRPPNNDITIQILSDICEQESLTYNKEGLQYIWNKTKPNLRKSILRIQMISNSKDSISPQNSKQVINNISNDELIKNLFELAKNKNYKEMEKEVDNLINDQGYNVEILMNELVNTSIYYLSKNDSKLFCKIAGRTSYNIVESNDQRTDIIDLLCSWSQDRSALHS